MSSSPEGDVLERALLDGCANSEYLGRRHSASGRETKRISESKRECSDPIDSLYLPCLPLLAVHLRRVA